MKRGRPPLPWQWRRHGRPFNRPISSPDAIDLILVSTTSPDMSFPSTACLVQRALSTRPIPALDLNASCSGFLYALSVGDQFIRNGTAKRVLIIAAEVKSPSINPGDPSTAILFGDGAAAVVLAKGKRGFNRSASMRTAPGTV
ncbi:MAG: hypothetical protein MPW15_09250 [Candidatus Manganitrophus sp.]|nr:hypothetical protein [Candidatus Manganitrophus sp.]